MEKDYNALLLEQMKKNNVDHVVFSGDEEDINDWDFNILSEETLEEGYKEWKRRNDNGK